MNINQEGARAAGAPMPTGGRGYKRDLACGRSPPWTPGGGAHTPLWRGDVFLCISGYVDSKKGI